MDIYFSLLMVYVLQHMCGGQRKTFEEFVLSFCHVVLGIALRLSGLTVNAFTS